MLKSLDEFKISYTSVHGINSYTRASAIGVLAKRSVHCGLGQGERIFCRLGLPGSRRREKGEAWPKSRYRGSSVFEGGDVQRSRGSPFQEEAHIVMSGSDIGPYRNERNEIAGIIE